MPTITLQSNCDVTPSYALFIPQVVIRHLYGESTGTAHCYYVFCCNNGVFFVAVMMCFVVTISHNRLQFLYNINTLISQFLGRDDAKNHIVVFVCHTVKKLCFFYKGLLFLFLWSLTFQTYSHTFLNLIRLDIFFCI